MKEHHSAKAHAKATAWAQSIAADPDACVLDLETCGKERDAEICDIGIVRIDGLVLMDQLVKPSHPIPAEASEIHGITNELVADAPSFEDLWAPLDSILEERRMVIYNADYDTAILINALKRIDRVTTVTGECAMKAFSELVGFPGKWPGSYKWWKLEEAAAKFGIKPGGHRALADAEATRQVVLAMARSGVPAEAHPPPLVSIAPSTGQQAMFDLPDPTRFTR